MKTEQILCKNCNQVTEGKYCFNCGQKTNTKRITDKEVGWEILKALTNLDTPFLRTLWGMIRKPGPTMAKYLDGQRKRYQNPITYFAVGGLVYLLAADLAKAADIYVGTLLLFHETNYLFLVLICVGFLAYLIVKKSTRHEFSEVLILLAYVYGTVLFAINTSLIIIDYIFIKMGFLKLLGPKGFLIFCDTPVILYVAYAFRSFFKARNLQMWTLFVVVSIEISVYLCFIIFVVDNVVF